MSLSYQESLDLVKTAHPDLYPIWYIEKDGQYLFNMLKRGVSKEEATTNFYAVDTKSGSLSGSLPVMLIYTNDSIAEKLSNPHMISPEDQKAINHSASVNGSGWSISFKRDDICHYGIKGQKWGVRRFQEENGSYTAAGKERYYGIRGESKQKEGASGNQKTASEYYQNAVGDKKLSFLERRKIRSAATGEAAIDSMADPTPPELIDRSKTKQDNVTKRVAVDLAYTILSPMNVVFLASDGISNGISSAKEKAYLKKREKNSEYDPETGFYMKKPGEYDEKQDLAVVNPRFNDMNTNSKNNCMLCTTTYDLRKRGYDVTAQKDSEGYTFGDLKRWYPDAKQEKNSRFNPDGSFIPQKQYIQNTINNLKKQGDGARGNLMIFYTQGGGHSIVYEVKNGQLYFKDGQANIVYKNPEKVLKMTSANSFARLDNIEPDLKRIKEECCV